MPDEPDEPEEADTHDEQPHPGTANVDRVDWCCAAVLALCELGACLVNDLQVIRRTCTAGATRGLASTYLPQAWTSMEVRVPPAVLLSWPASHAFVTCFCHCFCPGRRHKLCLPTVKPCRTNQGKYFDEVACLRCRPYTMAALEPVLTTEMLCAAAHRSTQTD